MLISAIVALLIISTAIAVSIGHLVISRVHSVVSIVHLAIPAVHLVVTVIHLTVIVASHSVTVIAVSHTTPHTIPVIKVFPFEIAAVVVCLPAMFTVVVGIVFRLVEVELVAIGIVCIDTITEAVVVPVCGTIEIWLPFEASILGYSKNV